MNEKKSLEQLDKERMLGMGEIGLWLDTYDDIFSDFDPRPYHHRALSHDFLAEAKRASVDKPSGKIELTFLIPEHKRKKSEEYLIRKRLRDHFKKHHEILKKQMTHQIIAGSTFVFFGILIMFIASVILFQGYNRFFFANFMVVLLEPGGWFLFWEGLNMIIFQPKSFKPELDFYQKMKDCKINYTSY